MTFKAILSGGLISFAIAACTQSADSNDSHVVTVYKSGSCGCCIAWVEHLRENGYRVETHDLDNLRPVKERVGIPVGQGSCHTAEVGGYFVEGHVPATDIRRLLAERPDAKGLALPGMPIGSPGMESPGRAAQRYDVLLVARDGSISVFSRHVGQEAQ